MNIVVLVKQTFDSEEKIVLDQGVVREEDATWVVNPYDEYAIEEAIRLRDRHGGEVTAVTVGPERATTALRTALAMGVDRAVRLDSEGGEADPTVTAVILATYLRTRPFDLILCGNVSIDQGTGQIGPRVAELLGIPQVTSVIGLTIETGTALAKREAEGDIETVEVRLPVLLAAQQGLNEPRYPSLPGIMKAKRMPLQAIGAGELGIELAALKARTAIVEQYAREKRGAVYMLAGDAGSQARELAQLLRGQHKAM